jgi:hypothetical protein
MKRHMSLVMVLLLGLLLTACASATPQVVELPLGAPMEKVVQSEAAADQSGEGASTQPGQPFVSADDQMIIRTGNLALIVKDTESAMAQIKDIADALGGYVANSNAYYSGEWLRGSMQVRVPAPQFDSAIDQFKALANRVENQSTSSQDVTEEYTDLSARLRNLEATETELVELLATVRQRTGNAEDILAVYREITDIRQQIEQLKGRMQYLERMTALASIDIELIPDQLGEPVTQPAWQPGVTLRNAWRALVEAFHVIIQALIWVIVFVLPILVAIALPILLVVWIIRTLVRRRRRAQ